MRLLQRLLARLRNLLEALIADDPRDGMWRAAANDDGYIEIRPGRSRR